MGNELLNPKYEKRPRIYYKGITSTGTLALRGSCADVYSYACARAYEKQYEVQVDFYASFHSTKELAEKMCKRRNNSILNDEMYEVVKLEKISGAEWRRLRRQGWKEVIKIQEKLIAEQLLEVSKESVSV